MVDKNRDQRERHNTLLARRFEPAISPDLIENLIRFVCHTKGGSGCGFCWFYERHFHRR
jgi:hypothetical protein